MAGQEPLFQLLGHEIDQRIFEGCALDRDEWIRRLSECDTLDNAAIERLYDELAAIAPASDFLFQEPNDLEKIRAARPNGVRDMGKSMPDRDVFDRMHGGWLGRCCGVALGRPFQTPPFSDNPKRQQRQAVRQWLEGAEAWPLDGFVPEKSSAEQLYQLRLAPTASTRERYMLTTLLAFESAQGAGDSRNFAEVWLERLTFRNTEGAIAQTLANLTNCDAFAHAMLSEKVVPEVDWARIATYRNPFREDIGAALRMDIHGYLNPGQPEAASESAWRDGRISHTGNGLYAAMFLAAVVAGAFFEDNPRHLVDMGLSEIPSNCRLSWGLRSMLKHHRDGDRWEDSWDETVERYYNLSTDSAIVNTVLTALALVYGDGDFDKSLGLAVAMGLRSNANAAAVGSVLGVMRGARAVPQRWVAPFRNAIQSDVLHYTETTISDCARRTMQVYEKLAGRPANPSE
jgi:ADP-ribosylglycohydrolase